MNYEKKYSRVLFLFKYFEINTENLFDEFSKIIFKSLSKTHQHKPHQTFHLYSFYTNSTHSNKCFFFAGHYHNISNLFIIFFMFTLKKLTKFIFPTPVNCPPSFDPDSIGSSHCLNSYWLSLCYWRNCDSTPASPVHFSPDCGDGGGHSAMVLGGDFGALNAQDSGEGRKNWGKKSWRKNLRLLTGTCCWWCCSSGWTSSFPLMASALKSWLITISWHNGH